MSTKEFIAAWKEATNSPKCKSKIVPCTLTVFKGSTTKQKLEREALGYKVQTYYYDIPEGGRCRITGWLTPMHHLYYNIATGKELHRGFTEITNKSKLDDHRNTMMGFFNAVRILTSLSRDATRLIEMDTEEKCNEWIEKVTNHKPRFGIKRKEPYTAEDYAKTLKYEKKRVSDFLEPFNGVVTTEDLAGVDLSMINSTWKFLNGGKV